MVRLPAAVVALIAGLLVAGVGVTGFAVASRTGHPAAPARAIPANSFAPIPRGKWAAVPPATIHTVAEPVSLDIPAIRVSTRLIHLGLTRAGTLQVPATVGVAGWYTGSPRPGEPGGAVIAGHIDGRAGAAEVDGVFYLLRFLKPGEKIYVRRADGTLAVFTITEVRLYPKAGFPDRRRVRADPGCPAPPDHLRRHVRLGHPSLPEQHDRLRIPDVMTRRARGLLGPA